MEQKKNTKPLTIGIDVRPLTNAHSGRGTGVYTGRILAAFKDLGTHRIIETDTPASGEFDILFVPNFEPFELTLPVRRDLPVIVTVHDLIPVANRRHFRIGVKGWIKWLIQKRRLSQTAFVITDSGTSKRDIIKYAGIRPSRTAVIPLAPTLPEPDKTINPDSVLNKYSLKKPYILYVGDLNWNKNIPGLLKAFAKVPGKTGVKLALVGRAFTGPDIPELVAVNQLIDKLGISDRIAKTGYVPDGDLAVFYQEAECFVFPSYAEGFGLPLLDALSMGTVTVASGVSSLAEIAGPSILVDPASADSIAAGLKKALSLSPKDRADFSRQARDYTGVFSWVDTARKTLDVITGAVG